MDLLTSDDLAPFATIESDKADALVAAAVAMACISAPCLADPDTLTDIQLAAAKAVLLFAVLRWNESGSGALSQQTVGPFGVTYDTRSDRRPLFRPTDIGELQKICKGATTDGGAFSVDTAANPMIFHDRLYGWPGDGFPYGFDWVIPSP